VKIPAMLHSTILASRVRSIDEVIASRGEHVQCPCWIAAPSSIGMIGAVQNHSMMSAPTAITRSPAGALQSHLQPTTTVSHKVRTVKRPVVVVPPYNDAAYAPILIERLLNLSRPVDVVIVDDNSPDGTAQKVRAHEQFGRRVFLIENDDRRGFGQACKDGFFWAVDNGYDVCVEMDADLSHDTDSVPR